MFNTASIFMRVQGRPTVYEPISGPARNIRMKIQDADSLVRIGVTLEMSTADAVGHASVVDGPFEQGGVFVQQSTTYRIDSILEGRSPGLLKFDLSRMDGPGVVRHNFAPGLSVMKTEALQVNGRTVKGHVNRQGVFWEDTGLGVPVESTRIVIVIRQSDAFGINAGDVLTIDGEDFTIYSVLKTGAGTVRIAL